jgi:peroxiredoxin
MVTILSPGVSSADLAGLMSAHGLRPVSPPAPASDFALPLIGGGVGSLSDFQGEWVVLTFWATWCGPCRMEMPSLERLHRERAELGLAVVGVSVDADLGPVERFVEELDLTFPNFWDEDGAAGRSYRASSIPLSYLIDPAGRIVGASRGARDWIDLLPMIDEVLDLAPAIAATRSAYATTPIELPAVLEPPTADLTLSDRSPRVGRPFHLDIRLRWAGHLDEYLPEPPKVHLPEGVIIERVTASTSSLEGQNVVTYRAELRADEPGRYALDPVELRYTPRLESSPVESRLEGPTVEVRPWRIAGLRPTTLLLASGAAALAATALLVVLARVRARVAGRKPEGADYEGWRARFDEARALRVRGDSVGFVLALAEIEQDLAEDDETSAAARRQMVEEARYGGRVPPAEELDRFQRRVELHLEKLRPDPDGELRASLRLEKEEAS